LNQEYTVMHPSLDDIIRELDAFLKAQRSLVTAINDQITALRIRVANLEKHLDTLEHRLAGTTPN